LENLRILIPALACVLVLTPGAASAQTAIQAHYADGQVWVSWDYAPPAPETFVILGSDTPITQFADSLQVGRLFEYEYVPGAIRQQWGPPNRGWKIPSAGGAGQDSLGEFTGLFVETVHAAGPRYFAVVAHGDSTITPGVNATTTPANALYGPGEDVECHLQITYPPIPGYNSRVFAMWADGRADPDDARPDFPVCANPAKNGMPSLFLISASNSIGGGPRPVTYWLHGGDGRAKQSEPGDRTIYGIDPNLGYLVGHNDDMVRWIPAYGAISEEGGNSWWFGWGLGHDPFPGCPATAPPGEVIVNYTQRRLVWIHQWLIGQGWVDPEHTSILGHSVGSAGTTALGKAYPDLFATCTMFNNGFGGPDSSQGAFNLYGFREDGNKTTFLDALGDSIPLYDAFDLTTMLAPGVDLPLFRSFHGKNDDRGGMMWDAFVTEQYRAADSLGAGMHLYWDERAHTPEGHPGHWAAGPTPAVQTQRDNVDYQEPFSVHQSFPAFFNHRLAPGAFDPGNGDPLTGDPWGTWGGYHEWELSSLLDQVDQWAVTAYLIDGSSWLPDNAPMDSLVCDLTIRRAQAFLPAPGETVDWMQLTMAGDTLRTGMVVADANGRLVLPSLVIYRDPLRTRIKFIRTSLVGIEPPATSPEVFSLDAFPNPFRARTQIQFALASPGEAELTVHDVQGRMVRRLLASVLAAGRHRLAWDGRDDRGTRVAAGIYRARLRVNTQVHIRSVVLLR